MAVRAIIECLSLLIVRLSHDNVMLATSMPAREALKDIKHICCDRWTSLGGACEALPGLQPHKLPPGASVGTTH